MPADIRDAIKCCKMRISNVAKNFVLKESEDCVIKRGSNFHSRKCTVAWHDTLPESISLDIKKVGI